MPEPVPGIVSGFSIKMFTNHGCFGGPSVNFSTNCIIMEKISDEEETKKSHSVTACVTGSKGFYTYRVKSVREVEYKSIYKKYQ